MRPIDADVLYERACNLEAQALDYVEKLIERDGDEVSVEWKIWSAILTERTAFKHDVFDAPTIDAVEVVRGEWIHNPQIGWGETWECSICGEKTTSSIMGKPRYKFCPMCGARMKGADDEQHTYGNSKQLL